VNQPLAMQEFLEFVIRHLVDFPDEMVLTTSEANKRTIFKLRVRQSDIGKVVGKHGQTILAIRNILNAAAARIGQKAVFEIIEEGRSGEDRS
jgi:predicted RNA-binding protein YlqC (UPF0109 family)